MKQIRTILLVGLLILGVVFLGYELEYAATRDRSEFGTVESSVRLSHILFTVPLLLFPIAQFSRRLRRSRPAVHRRLGQVYLASAIIAALGAAYLGLTFEEAGRRPPLVLFALVWIFFSSAAWVSARRKDFGSHARFVTRSYGVALAFVFVRVLGEFETSLFGYIPSEEVRGVTREWVAFVLPLVLIEGAVSWLPSMRSGGQGSKAVRDAA